METVADLKGSTENNLRTTATVYSPLIQNEENTSQTHFYAYQTFHYRPMEFECVQQTMVRTVHAFIDLSRRYFSKRSTF